MKLSQDIKCPVCNSGSFVAKYEATYVYTYVLDTNAPGSKNEEEFLPFLFDNREQTHSRTYVECRSCGTRYPCSFDYENPGIHLTIMQKAIRAPHAEQPEFLG